MVKEDIKGYDGSMGGNVYGRGKIMSQRANELQRPFLANSIYCSDPISKMSKTAARHE